ncbi:hypothetical protein Aduo_003745 [Ancylostoma duodenale]
MACIHELQHTFNGILLLPCFLQSAGSQDYLRATLEIFHVTEDVLREALAFSSAVSAHATRLIRILEAYQLEHVAQQHQQDMTPLDEDYQRLFQTSMPLALPPTSPGPHLQSLLWWRSHYSETLRANATREYLQLVEREGPLLPTTITARCTIAATAVYASSSSAYAPTYTMPALRTPVVSSIASMYVHPVRRLIPQTRISMTLHLWWKPGLKCFCLLYPRASRNRCLPLAARRLRAHRGK